MEELEMELEVDYCWIDEWSEGSETDDEEFCSR